MGRSLKNINIWYAHKETRVLLVTQVPPAVRAYNERGWPCFEKAISQMLTCSDFLMDVSGLSEDFVTISRPDACREAFDKAWHSDDLQIGRTPPLLPEEFAEILA